MCNATFMYLVWWIVDLSLFLFFPPWNGFFYDSVGGGSRWSLCVPMDFKTHTGWMTQWLRRFPKPDSLWSVTHIILNQLERIDLVPAGVAPLTIHVRIDPVTWINALNGHICYGKHRSVQSVWITPSCWVLLRVCSRQHDPRQTYLVCFAKNRENGSSAFEACRFLKCFNSDCFLLFFALL